MSGRIQVEKEGAKARSASRRAAAALSLEALKIGDVIKIPSGRRAGWAVVVQPAKSYKGEVSTPSVVTEDKHLVRLTLTDVPAPVEPVTRVKVPPHFNAKSPKARRDLSRRHFAHTFSVLNERVEDIAVFDLIPVSRRHGVGRACFGGHRGSSYVSQ